MMTLIPLHKHMTPHRSVGIVLVVIGIHAVNTCVLASPIPLSQPTTQMKIATTLPHISEIDTEKLKQSLPKQEEIDRVMTASINAIHNAIKHYQVPADLAERAHQDARFPMTSDLTPGHVETQTVNVPNNVPAFYVMSDDALSIEWFYQHKQTLQDLHAIGLVTNIDSQTRFESLQTELGVNLHPTNLTDINAYLPVQHYPFWFAGGTIRQ